MNEMMEDIKKRSSSKLHVSESKRQKIILSETNNNVSETVSTRCSTGHFLRMTGDETIMSKHTKPKITIILQHTSLILNRYDKKKSDNSNIKLLHSDSIVPLKYQRNELPRPDITHQCLVMLLDSPLNKVGLLNILLENSDGKIISVNPEFRIPRTWKVFSKVMADFLTNSRGQLLTSNSDSPLLTLLEPPLTKHIEPENSLIVTWSQSGRVAKLRDVIPRLLGQTIASHQSLVLIIDVKNMEDSTKEVVPKHRLSISNYAVASSVVCNRLCNELELAMGI